MHLTQPSEGVSAYVGRWVIADGNHHVAVSALHAGVCDLPIGGSLRTVAVAIGQSGHDVARPAVQAGRADGHQHLGGTHRTQLHLRARVLAVADAYDAMTSSRVYRARNMTEEEALDEILAGAGSQFDPVMAAAFVEHRRRAPVTKTAAANSRSPAAPQPAARVGR